MNILGTATFLTDRVLPMYDALDDGHSREHILKVSKEIDKIAIDFGLDRVLCQIIAFYHDLGLLESRDWHETRSAHKLRNSVYIVGNFSPKNIELMAEAIEDHRISLGREPRSLYGKAIAEAGRDLEPYTLIGKYVSGFINYSEKDLEWAFEWAYNDMCNKYIKGECVLWLETERNTRNLTKLKEVLSNKEKTKEIYYSIYYEKKANKKLKYTKFKDIPQAKGKGRWECLYSLVEFDRYIKQMQEMDGLNIQPDFQRSHVWTETQQIEWLEFILRGGVTSRAIYINDNIDYGGGEDGTIVLVDGLQRLTAVRRFLNNEIKVFGSYYMEYRDKLTMENGLYINKNNLKTRQEVLEWYLEMNSSGTPHTQKELDRVRELLKYEKSKNKI